MEPTGALAEADWRSHRPAVFGAAYRILGSVAEAEDVAQEVWLRAVAADLSEVRDLRAWLVTLAARASYNVLKSARVRRESYVGPWLPEPLLTGPDAAAQVLVDESVSTAMLVVMETLTPAERVELVLHDVFGFPFGRIAEVLGGTPAAGHKLASRARARVAAVKERPRPSRAEAERLLKAFKAAADAGNLAELVELPHPEAVYVADGGGEVTAARRPVQGAARIALLAVRTVRPWSSVPGSPVWRPRPRWPPGAGCCWWTGRRWSRTSSAPARARRSRRPWTSWASNAVSGRR